VRKVWREKDVVDRRIPSNETRPVRQIALRLHPSQGSRREGKGWESVYPPADVTTGALRGGCKPPEERGNPATEKLP